MDTSPFSATDPFSLVIFGASGHLAKLKLYPALYVLALKKRLPENYAIIGFARTEMDDTAFRTLIEESIRADMGSVNEEVLGHFLNRVTYHHGAYDHVEDFTLLASRIAELEQNWGANCVRLAYLSIPPMVFSHTLHNICKGGIHVDGKPFRCIVEKPVGHDLKSFESLREDLLSCYDKEEIYLLDHYLGKEAVRNVYYLRYANPVFERLFKNTLIKHVEITALESAGIEGRAGYFEHSGTFRDMFQSHLLMMGALLTMRLRDGDPFLPESRLEALSQFYLPPASHLEEIALQGQYTHGQFKEEQMMGYREEQGVDPQSRTNTYAALMLLSRESRFQGVPFFLRSGKRLHKKETRITIEFNEPRIVGKGSTANRLDIILQGEAGMRLHLQTKVGGTEPTFRPLVMEDPLVCYGDCLPEHALLLLEAIHGKRHWFLTFEEIMASWKLIDPIQAYFAKEETPLHMYPAGSLGPAEADTWVKRHGVEWF